MKRLEYFDIAKGIGILSIILGHMGAGIINKIVFTFHVPLFFLISGYFISRKNTFKEYAIKRTKALVKPYIFTSFLLILIHIPIGIINGKYSEISKNMMNTFVAAVYGSGTNSNRTLFGIQQIGAIWFLLALLWSVLFVKRVIDNRYRTLIIFTVAIVAYISSFFVWLPWDIQAGGTAAIFVYFGALLREKNFEVKKEQWYLFCIGIVVLILEVRYNIIVFVVKNYYKYTIVSILGAVIISYSVLYLSKCLEKTNAIKRILKFYGENSNIILCFHLIELNNAPWWIITDKFTGSLESKIVGYITINEQI